MQARRALPDAERERQNDALGRHLLAAAGSRATIAAYLPVGTEPGSVAVLDALTARGVRVLLPIARNDRSGTPEPMRWADYRPGELVAAPFGLREPISPALEPAELAAAELVLVPALAADRRGNRLGRGAGFYDRSLRFAAPQADLVAVLYADEIRDGVPAGPHDIPVTHAVTPDGLVTFG